MMGGGRIVGTVVMKMLGRYRMVQIMVKRVKRLQSSAANLTFEIH